MSVEKTTAPRTVQDARRAVEQSRERIAATLDELEDRIVETKASIKRKADVARPAREAIQKAPLIALGVAVAVGLFLGTRGGDEDEDEDGHGFEKDERKALEEWRKRRRKMLLEEAESDADSFGEEESAPGPFGRLLRSVGHEVAGVAIGIIAAEIGERLYGARAGGPRDAVASDENYEDDYDGVYDDDYDEQ